MVPKAPTTNSAQIRPSFRQGGPPGHWSDLAFVWAKPRLCGAFLGPGAPQGKSLAQPGNLANSVALEPVALVAKAVSSHCFFSIREVKGHRVVGPRGGAGEVRDPAHSRRKKKKGGRTFRLLARAIGVVHSAYLLKPSRVMPGGHCSNNEVSLLATTLRSRKGRRGWPIRLFNVSTGFNSSVTSCRGSRTRGGAASHSREQIAFPSCSCPFPE
jgi:hypothetical protein